jgi:hypothetical protein
MNLAAEPEAEPLQHASRRLREGGLQPKLKLQLHVSQLCEQSQRVAAFQWVLMPQLQPHNRIREAKGGLERDAKWMELRQMKGIQTLPLEMTR